MRLVKNIGQRILKSVGYEFKYHKVQPIHKGFPQKRYGHKSILSPDNGNNLIGELLLTDVPLSVGRIGSIEMSLLYNYISYHHRNMTVRWSNGVRDKIWTNAGVFPTDSTALAKFAEIYLDAISSLDILGVWFNEGEEMVTKRYCPNANLVELAALEPYYYEKPWSEVLNGKTVLIVHPFEMSIRKQLTENRERLFDNHLVLPEFQFSTIKAVQSLANNKGGFDSWFEALDSMKAQIAKADFDVAIIGAGAYGLPLAHYTKSLGKKAIHLGGATQILFGIKGNRWDMHPVISKLYNEFWIRPVGSEIVPDIQKVEGGCYW